MILASNSPRRKQLLSYERIPFTVEPSHFEEKADDLCASERAERFARGKAEDVYSRHPESYVLGADTVVELDGEILGKPASPAEAAAMLRRMSGKVHSVFTGVCLIGNGECLTGVEETKVRFKELSDELIDEYVRSGLPLDRAGAYGIQDDYPVVESYEGSYTNVVGLPLGLVRRLLKKAGLLC